MKITWHGGSTIELETKKQRAILNPTDKKQSEKVQLVVHGLTDDKHLTPEEALMVDWPGEYDTSGFTFRGVEVHGKKDSTTVYSFQSSAGNVAWMGELAEYPDEATVESLGEVHVLIVPVGGKDVLDAKNAFKLVEQLEPLVVIPVCYGDKRDGLPAFLKEMDVKHPEAQKNYECKKSVLGGDQMELIILDAV
jgi:L-ascorbate metabolism protein UlaG (beta-lactamase superfamily)